MQIIFSTPPPLFFKHLVLTSGFLNAVLDYLSLCSSSSNKVQATVVDYRTGACGVQGKLCTGEVILYTRCG